MRREVRRPHLELCLWPPPSTLDRCQVVDGPLKGQPVCPTCSPNDGYIERVRAAEWGKRADMIVHGNLPFNAEASRAALAPDDITPADAFYTRNHGPVPISAPRTGG